MHVFNMQLSLNKKKVKMKSGTKIFAVKGPGGPGGRGPGGPGGRGKKPEPQVGEGI